MKRRRETLLSFLYATKPLTRRASGRQGIHFREAAGYVLAFVLVAATVGFCLHWHLKTHHNKEMASWRASQSSLADDQAQRVADWLKERQGDAQVLSASPAVRAVLGASDQARQLPKHPPGEASGSRGVLDEMARRYSEAGVYVLDRDANVEMQASPSIPLNPLFSEPCRAVARSGAVQIAMVGDAPSRTLIGFIAPVLPEPETPEAGRRAGPPLGTVLVVTDASQTLFHLVTRDVVPTRTGETLLVRREGNDVVYFSPVHNVAVSSLYLRIPWSVAPSPARLALEGHSAFGEYKDYEGVPVLATTQYIPATGWGLIRKINSAEAFEKFQGVALTEGLAGGLMVIFLACLMIFHRRDVMVRALEQDEKKFKALLESPPDVMIVVDRTGRIVFVNSATEKMFGYKLEELLGKSYLVLLPRRFHTETAAYYAHLQPGARSHAPLNQREVLCRRKDGSEFPAEVTTSTIETLKGAVVGVAVRDITERKRAEADLRESEERFRSLFENAPMGLYRTTPDGRILAGNPAFVRMLGYSSFEELASRDLNADGFEPEYNRSHFIELMEKRGEVAGLECVWHKKDGGDLYVRENARAIRDETGKILCYEGTVEDITEHKRAEAEHLRLVTAIEQSEEAVLITNTAGRIEYVNPAFTRITGYSREEALGRNPNILKSGKQDPELYQQLWTTILKGQPWRGELVNQRKDGSLYTEQMNITPVRGPNGVITHFIATKQDVTEHKTLEAQLQQAAKIEAVGRLAGGVAHDFNNLLTIINGYAELLLDQLAADPMVSGQLQEIKNAGDRAASLTRQLLAFSRRQVLAAQVLDLNAVIYNLENMLRRLIGEDVKLYTHLDPALGRVKADPGQIEQVIMNLAVNARDAMPSGGELTLETCNVVLDETFARSHATVKAGPHVMLAVSDTGVGMTPETKTHIFEPFFTTKEQGKGTGLGLATVYGIVKQSGGSIWAYSELGHGSVFKVFLPVVSESLAVAEQAMPETDSNLGTETILVVEDEEGVRSLVRIELESFGYKVLASHDAEDALATCAQYDGPVHLLLTDVVMPHMSGPVVAEKVAALRPNIKVLYMSGYTDDAIVHHGVLTQEMPFIQKPFSPLALRKKIREVLG